MSERFSLTAVVIGAVFVGLGVLFALDAYDVLRLRADVVFSIAVIALGVAVIAGALLRPRDEIDRS